MGNVGRYRIVRELGQGAWGTTYEAKAEDGGAPVVLKEIHLSQADVRQVLPLLEREARALTKVSHAIVPAYVDQFTVNVRKDTSFYAVQRFAPGRSLLRRAARAPRVTEAEARHIAEALVAALVYLHALDPPVIHGDIDPRNVLLEESGNVWLVDFGGLREICRTTLRQNPLSGTYGYAAPEQLRGITLPQSDMYSIGATLVFLLSGHVPAEMMKSQYVIEFQSHVNVSPAFARWLAKMLAPDPEDRFPSAKAALNALKGPPSKGRAGFLRGGFFVTTALATAAAAALVALVLRAWAKGGAHPDAYPLLPPRVTDSVLPALALSGPKAVLPVPKLVPKARPTERSLEEHDYELAMELVDNYEGHHEQLDNARALLRGILDKNPRSPLAYSGLGSVAFRQGHYGGDEYEPEQIAKAREYAEKAIELDPSLADAYVVAGWVARAEKRAVEARSAVDTAVKLAPAMLRARVLAAALAMDEGDPDKAEHMLRDMLARPMSQGWASSLFGWLAEAYVRKGDYEAADEAYRRDIELAPTSPWAKGEYARFLLRRGDSDAALTMAQQAIFQLRFPLARRVASQAYCIKGETMLWSGDTDGSSRAFWEASRADPTYSRVPYDFGALHQYLGVTKRDPGEIEQARGWYRNATELDPKDELAAGAIAVLHK
jgi:tetratricopeptide (TPR) repeat protein